VSHPLIAYQTIVPPTICVSPLAMPPRLQGLPMILLATASQMVIVALLTVLVQHVSQDVEVFLT
jgi:hypothetical protein